MATTAQIAAAYAAKQAIENAEKQKTQAVEAWVASFFPAEEPLCLERSHTSRNHSKSRSDRHVGLSGKQHRNARNSRRLAEKISQTRDRHATTAFLRKVNNHVAHHIGVALATARKGAQKATAAIAQYAY